MRMNLLVSILVDEEYERTENQKVTMTKREQVNKMLPVKQRRTIYSLTLTF